MVPRLRPSPQQQNLPMIWSGKEVVQLPKVSARPGFDRRPNRRADFTEIEIPALLPQYALTDDLHTSQTASPYQLFPAKNPLPVSPKTSILQYPEQLSQPKEKCSQNAVQDSVASGENLNSMYINHSVMTRDKVLNDRRPICAVKPPKAFPFVPTKAKRSQASVPWQVETQSPCTTGDNSLTALQMAKSLSEVDFFPTEEDCPKKQTKYKNSRKMAANVEYGWIKEVRLIISLTYLHKGSYKIT